MSTGRGTWWRTATRRRAAGRCGTGRGTTRTRVIHGPLRPLIIGDTEVRLFCEAFADVMNDAHQGGGLMWDFGRALVKQALTR